MEKEDNKKEKKLLDDKEIAKRLKALRESRNVSQNELAKNMGCTGSHISQIENNNISLSMMMLNEYHKFFGVPTDYILYGRLSDSAQALYDAVENVLKSFKADVKNR